jgi:hypothetical protein
VTPGPLLEILLAGLRGQQEESNCFLCLTSDDPRDLCVVHCDRLRTLVDHGKPAEPDPSEAYNRRYGLDWEPGNSHLRNGGRDR